MKSAEYLAYLRSPQWQDFREEALAHYGRKCHWCDSGRRLQVHHLTYRRLGHEHISDVRVMCAKCHREADQVRADHPEHWCPYCDFYFVSDGNGDESCPECGGDYAISRDHDPGVVWPDRWPPARQL
jgi:hypothetical protein